jgi:hypothetical protein
MFAHLPCLILILIVRYCKISDAGVKVIIAELKTLKQLNIYAVFDISNPYILSLTKSHHQNLQIDVYNSNVCQMKY